MNNLEPKQACRTKLRFLLLALAMSAGACAHAAVWTFTNRADPTWTTPLNWSPSGGPVIGVTNFPGRANVNASLLYDSPLTTGLGTLTTASPEYGRGLVIANGSNAMGAVTSALVLLEVVVCDYAISPTSRSHGPGAEAGSATVVAGAGCPWSVRNTNSWIAVTSATNGQGSGEIRYAVAPNPPGADPRSGELLVGNFDALVYDDGDPNGGARRSSPGDGYALRFTPPDHPYFPQMVSLNVVNYTSHPSNPTQALEVRFYGDNRGQPGNLLASGIFIAATDVPAGGNRWASVNVRTNNIVITEGDFYVEVVWLVANSPMAGFDSSSPDEQRTWAHTGGNWSWSATNQGWAGWQLMLRVEGTEYSPPRSYTVSQNSGLTFAPSTAGALVTDPGYWQSGAWGDFDNNGTLDLFVTDWQSSGNRLYRNNGDGTFANVTADPLAAGTNSVGGIWGDYDNDGYLDLFAATYQNSQNVSLTDYLYRNNGDGTFSQITTGPVVTSAGASQGPAWGDYDNDGWLDLYVPNAGDDFLHRNNGAGGFTLITVQDNRFSTSCTWGDYDNDGALDLFVAHGTNVSLYHNNGAGTLTRITTGALGNVPGQPCAGAWADYDNDGDLDLFVTSWAYAGDLYPNLLFRNDGGGNFIRVTDGAIVTDISECQTPAWGDYDNDGWLDLFVANGGYTNLRNFLYHNNRDGTFTRVTSGCVATDMAQSVGAAWGDYDNDGFLDLFVANGNREPQTCALYHNNGNSNSWLLVKLAGTRSNHAAIGAKVRVQATIHGVNLWQMREISGGHGCGSQNDLRAHFGLGDAAVVETVRIEWPSRVIQEFQDVPARQLLTVTEPDLPTITIQPDRVNTYRGCDAAFAVTGAEGWPLTLQWYFNGNPVPDATNTILLLSDVQTNQSGSYSVIAFDGTNWVTARPAALNVYAVEIAPTIV